MNALVWTVRIVVMLVILWFAAKNADVVTLNGFGGNVKAPMALILLAFFGAGLILGLVSSLTAIFRLRREVRQLNRALQNKSHGQTATSGSPGGSASGTPETSA